MGAKTGVKETHVPTRLGGKHLALETSPEQLSWLASPLRTGYTCSGEQSAEVAAHVRSVHCHVPRVPSQAPGGTRDTEDPDPSALSCSIYFFSPMCRGDFIIRSSNNGKWLDLLSTHPWLSIFHAVLIPSPHRPHSWCCVSAWGKWRLRELKGRVRLMKDRPKARGVWLLTLSFHCGF